MPNPKPLPNNRVLLTGGTGLIGKEAVSILIRNGYEVYALARHVVSPRRIWIKADLFDRDAVSDICREIRPSYLLHFAWKTIGDYLTSPENEGYVSASMHLLESFAENGGRAAVFAGTCMEYDVSQKVLKEDATQILPATIYGQCKDRLRSMGRAYCVERGIAFGWGRIFNVFGMREHASRLTGMVIDRIRRNREVLIANGDSVRDYMYAKDVAAAFVSMVNRKMDGVVNVCTGQGVSVAYHAMTIAEKLGKPYLIHFSNETATQPTTVIGSADLLYEKIGFRPSYTHDSAIDEIVRESCAGMP